jgi:hypothetical protein
VNPVGAEARREDRNRNDSPFGELSLFRENIDQFLIGKHFRTAHIESLSYGFLMFETTLEIIEYVSNAYRL